MICFMFRGLPWFGPGSSDRMPVAVLSVPPTALYPHEGPALVALEIRFPLEE
jgi:hypothetical protein